MNHNHVDLISEIWATVIEYVPRKSLTELATEVVDILEGHGFQTEDFQELADHDNYLATAIRLKDEDEELEPEIDLDPDDF